MDGERSNIEQLGDAENKAIHVLDVDLGSHLELTADLFNFIAESLALLPEVALREMSQARKVLTALLIRLCNDLRCASLLAIRGYPVQAAGLVSSMYEIAYTVVFIGADESRAQAWIDHDHVRRPFKRAFDLTREVISAYRVPDVNAHVVRQYQVYTQLCMAKHANPLSEKADAFEVNPSRIVFTNEPRSSPAAIRAAQFALEHAAGLSFIALVTLVDKHIAGAPREFLAKQLEVFQERHKKLNEDSLRRYGNEDPFPGKW